MLTLLYRMNDSSKEAPEILQVPRPWRAILKAHLSFVYVHFVDDPSKEKRSPLRKRTVAYIRDKTELFREFLTEEALESLLALRISLSASLRVVVPLFVFLPGLCHAPETPMSLNIIFIVCHIF
jgi:hypothetical protein